ncbi:uncharacterized protein TNCV_2027241 [Trichonephila clavipes]|nr:uncharacterized protein TNCV_2027241 [Trichonephila clavipes]
MPVLRETGASLDIGCKKYAAPEMFTGEHASIKHIVDNGMTCLRPAELENTQTTRKEAEKSTRLENGNDQFKLRECVVENGEDFVSSFTREGTDNGNLVKLSACETIEVQLRSEESAHLIRGTENGASDEASDLEGASMQLIPVRQSFY